MVKTVTSYALVTLMIIVGLFGRIIPVWIAIPVCLFAIYLAWKAFAEKGSFYPLFAMFYALIYIIWIIVKSIL